MKSRPRRFTPPGEMPPLESKRQMVAKIAKRPFGSVWRQIMKTKHVGRLEMLWITRRSHLGKLFPAGFDRKPDSVLKRPRLKARSDVHTHILDHPSDSSLPSVYDLIENIQDVRFTKGIRKWHVVSVSPISGIPRGVITIQASKRFVWNSESRRIFDRVKKEFDFISRNEKHISHHEFWDTTNLLRIGLLKIGLRVRIRARPGFVFRNFRFVKK